MRRVPAMLATALCLLAFPMSVQAASDPLFVFTPSPPPLPPLRPLPTGYFNGPCGLAVDSSGRFYVADYYHHAIDVYDGNSSYSGSGVSGATGFLAQLPNEDLLDGPCGLALDSSNRLYVNNYHRNVIRFSAQPTFTPGPIFPLPSENTQRRLPTGVAVDTLTDRVYVSHRTYVSVFDSVGVPIEEGGEPLLIGGGSLGDAYGVAVSQFPGTLGRLYIPDSGTNTVKVYDPATSTTTPVAEIKDPFGKAFVSLRDSAVAVDRVTGDVYFADNNQPQSTEQPQATIYVYSSAGTYKGHLKYNVIDALPPGLAVDNSGGSTQGRVYVTSGNTDKASVYAYAPGSATTAAPLPPLNSGLKVPGSAEAGEAPGVSHDGEASPKKLPREDAAPISVSVGWDIATTDGSPPPKVKTLRVEINRNGRFDYEGLPICPIAKIQPATTQRALSNCRSALVGQGSFSARIALKGQEAESYEAHGRLLVFNGENKGKPVLFGQIYSAHPFATSFVILFKVSMLGAGCPAPKGFSLASFKLARTAFGFTDGKELSATVVGSCRVRP